MAQQVYHYLTRGSLSTKENPFFSRLAEELSKAQKKAPPAQWSAFIKGLTKKGVKGTEIDEVGIIPWLEKQVENGIASISRTDLLAHLATLTPIIKEVPLAKPVYSAYRYQGENESEYVETLYIWNSEKGCYEDRLAEIRFDIEELDLNPMLLSENPERVLELYEEQQELLQRSKTAKGHPVSHFGGVKDPTTGERVVNMIAHARTSVFDDTFFVQEIQSDWAQQGRKNNWTRTPKGPFVTATELWSGLVLRRLMQKAANMPHVKRFAWIVGNMRNGGRFISPDNLDAYYTEILPKIADRAVSGTGVKTTFIKVQLGDKEFDVPGLEFNDKAREKLKAAQPLYSRDTTKRGLEIPTMTQAITSELSRAVHEAHEMLGDSVSIRLAARVLDAATGEEVAGRHLGRLIEVSLGARNPTLVVPHEAWHYASEHLIGPLDRQAVERAFSDGTYLNSKVRMALVKDGASPEAVAQCEDAREAAAHGFALWTQGKIQITREKEREAEFPGEHLIDRTVGKVFKKVESAFMSLSTWIKRKVGEREQSVDVRRVEDVFAALRSGSLAQKNNASSAYEEELAADPSGALHAVRMRQRA